MKKAGYFLIFILAGAIVVYLLLVRNFARDPDTLYVNGHFLTLNPDFPEADAMLVERGKITAIGTRVQLEADLPAKIRTVDLEGKTVMPGFIDPHTHFALSLFLHNLLDLSGFRHRSDAEVWAFFAEAVKSTPKGEWIVGKGIDPVMIDDLTMPSLQLLDSLAPEHPVLLFSQSLHSYWANSLAFERVGITAETPDPTEKSYYEKDAEGNLTGLIVEQAAILPIFDLLKEEVLTPDAMAKAAVEVGKEYARNGNTTIVSAGLTITDSKPLLLLEHLFGQQPNFIGNLAVLLGKLPARSPMPRHFVYMRHDMSHLLPEEGPSDNDFYGIIGIKHWYDGSPYIGSMYLDEPYLDTPFAREKGDIVPGQKGEALIDAVDFREFIRTNTEKGWQIAIHAQGDAATHETLDAFEEVGKDLDFSALRHRLEHCLLLDGAKQDRMLAMNMSPSFHINHLYYYGDALKDGLLGEERVGRMLPLRTYSEAGIPFSLHADQPMFPSEPFRLIQTAVERKSRLGTAIGPDQRISLMEAIKSMTVYAAWQIHREDELGSLEPGKYADFIILDKDPFQTPVGELQDISVLATYVSGNLVN